MGRSQPCPTLGLAQAVVDAVTDPARRIINRPGDQAYYRCGFVFLIGDACGGKHCVILPPTSLPPTRNR